MALLVVFACFFSLIISSTNVLSATVKTLEVPASGPESIAFDWSGAGPYTAVCDGRIIKYAGSDGGFVDFAYTSPKRTKSKCDGTNSFDLGYECGRPLGIAFFNPTKQLYIADGYHKLCSVGPEGGLATQIATVSDDGIPLLWLDGLDVDQNTGIVYFTDVSTVYNMSLIFEHLRTGDSTGRLIKYDPATGEVNTLMSNLKGAGGVVVSEDSSFVLVSELTGNKISKYWLKGPKAKTSEVLVNLQGPANMKRTRSGQFWIATGVHKEGSVVPTGVRIDSSGKILETVPFGEPYTNTYINDVHEKDGALYIGSMVPNFVGVYTDEKLSSAGHEEL